jgi:hypothetical protein
MARTETLPLEYATIVSLIGFIIRVGILMVVVVVTR